MIISLIDHGNIFLTSLTQEDQSDLAEATKQNIEMLLGYC